MVATARWASFLIGSPACLHGMGAVPGFFPLPNRHPGTALFLASQSSRLICKENDAMQVYVVTAGSYSDYHICAIFSTEEAALEYGKTLKFGGSIEVWDVDADRKLLPGCYVARLNSKGEGANYYDPHGSKERTVQYDQNEYSTKHAVWGEGWTEASKGQLPREGMRELIFIGYGETEEHAIRSASELRRQFLAIPDREMAEREFVNVREFAPNEPSAEPSRVIEIR